MVEFVLPVALAAVTGLSVLTSRMYNRMHELDKRVDQVELRVAEQYVRSLTLRECLTVLKVI